MEIVIKDFYQNNCSPCKMMVPVLDEVASEYPDVKIEKINVEEHPDQAAEFNVMGVPSVFIIADGNIVHYGKGYHPYELVSGKLNELLGNE